MRQGEIWQAEPDPAKGKEQKGLRPVIVISGNAMNANSGLCIVCPLSSKIKHFPGCVVLKKDTKNGLKHDSEILSFQVSVLSAERLHKRLGTTDHQTLQNVISGLNEVLTY
jgi:mRNA interferase MazF